jgi:glyoxylase I family protein
MSAPPRPDFEIVELDHVVLRVRDQEVSQRFYTEVLGLTLDHVNVPIRLVQLRAGRHLLDLLPLDEAESGSGGGGGETRMDHLCFSLRCDDLDTLVEFLRSRAVPIDGETAIRRGAFGSGPSVYVRDPDGYRIELKPR